MRAAALLTLLPFLATISAIPQPSPRHHHSDEAASLTDSGKNDVSSDPQSYSPSQPQPQIQFGTMTSGSGHSASSSPSSGDTDGTSQDASAQADLAATPRDGDDDIRNGRWNTTGDTGVMSTASETADLNSNDGHDTVAASEYRTPIAMLQAPAADPAPTLASSSTSPPSSGSAFTPLALPSAGEEAEAVNPSTKPAPSSAPSSVASAYISTYTPPPLAKPTSVNLEPFSSFSYTSYKPPIPTATPTNTVAQEALAPVTTTSASEGMEVPNEKATVTVTETATAIPTTLPTSMPTAAGEQQVLAVPTWASSWSSTWSGEMSSSSTYWSTSSSAAEWPTPTDSAGSSSASAMDWAAPSATLSTSSATYSSTVSSSFASTSTDSSGTPTSTPAAMSASAMPSSSALSAASAGEALAENTKAVDQDGQDSNNNDNDNNDDTQPNPLTPPTQPRKIRYKQCPSTGTITQITVMPCEGGKGTILDPCQFHAGSNYSINITYVTPLASTHPRSSLTARDRSMSNGPGSENFAYSGQSFDGCSYTTCPVPANKTSTYTYNFHTLNDRFDQLAFNLTEGFDGPSMFCGHFPLTFVPSVVTRKRRLPFAGLGARGPA